MNKLHGLARNKLTRARDGRGFRGLGGPVEDAGITDDVVHADETSRRGPLSLRLGIGPGRVG